VRRLRRAGETFVTTTAPLEKTRMLTRGRVSSLSQIITDLASGTYFPLRIECLVGPVRLCNLFAVIEP
jgi:hypothetical protein